MSAPLPAYGDEPGVRPVIPALYNVVYCRRVTAGVDDAELQRSIATARRSNARQGITGMLVFGSGIFFQWLEGSRDNVTALMALLRADPRHENIVELSAEEDIGERVFPEWDMELVSSGHIRSRCWRTRSAVPATRTRRGPWNACWAIWIRARCVRCLEDAA